MRFVIRASSFFRHSGFDIRHSCQGCGRSHGPLELTPTNENATRSLIPVVRCIVPRPDPTSRTATRRPDQPDIREIVDLYWETVYRLLYRLTGNTHDTEDLTQETFLRAMQRLEALRPGSNVRAWLLKIASNAFFDVHRRRRTASMRALETEPADTAGPPGEAVEASELNELLDAAIAALPDKSRVVFLLRAREGLSFREISEIIGTTEETARWHMLQARKALLASLNGKL